MSRFLPEDATPEEISRQADLYGPFTQAIRDLVDAGLRTLVDGDDVRTAQAEIEAVTARLRKEQIDGGFGVRYTPEGKGRAWGNAVMGLRNAIAPPLTITIDADGRAVSDFHLGAAYEGPPGLVHGGMISMVLDQMLGQAAGAGGRPGMTGTLTIVYRQGTPLGDLRAEAWIDRSEGIKTWAKGHLIGPDGVTAEAEGIFVLPRWARQLLVARDEQPPEFFE
ncbi:MAG: PaaI family thioesterase [Nocardioidaceae bacterium]|nr:PaaI family thioesterase [Nocardioidaceae bacterium]MCL2613481.1 PaaI family thioesterase [Nocardioidaceae bacterium]